MIDDYFAAVTAQDIDLLRRLFAPDARSTSTASAARGHDDICAYYTDNTFTFEDFRPAPGPLHSTAPP